ncbi:unnamed protein product [Linum trigynum]|uniref:DUF4057 domain-containing protein n=1 Tax=Linum trigynum TaxID=586398 RepID=A0AAV2CIT2_9ROSI
MADESEDEIGGAINGMKGERSSPKSPMQVRDEKLPPQPELKAGGMTTRGLKAGALGKKNLAAGQKGGVQAVAPLGTSRRLRKLTASGEEKRAAQDDHAVHGVAGATHQEEDALADSGICPSEGVLDSDDCYSPEDKTAFEIKRRSPLAAPTRSRLPPTGNVSKVVEAFERGGIVELVEGESLSIRIGGHDIRVPQEKHLASGANASPRLNEYGSNLLDPEPGNQKRSLDVLEGDVGDPPTSKKLFVEFAEVGKKVEEASLERPQGNK